MLTFLLSILSSFFLVEIEIGLLAFISTIVIIGVAVIVKIIKNKKIEKNHS